MGGGAVLPIKYLTNAYDASGFRQEYMSCGLKGVKIVFLMQKYRNHLGRTKLAVEVAYAHLHS